MAKAHSVHTDPTGKHAWTQEGGHCACGGGHALTAQTDSCPNAFPMVVLRCRCSDPEDHASKGEHCPNAEIDVGASYDAFVSFNQA